MRRARRRCCRRRSRRDAATVIQQRGRLTRRAASSTDRAGTLSVTAFRFSGWHDESFHYLPALSVTAPSTGRPVFVQRVDFTADDAGGRRLLKGVRYAAAQRVQPGGTIELVSDAGAADPAEIVSPLALDSISAIVFFTDDEGQTGIVSAVARVPDVPERASARVTRDPAFTVGRRQHQGRFLYCAATDARRDVRPQPRVDQEDRVRTARRRSGRPGPAGLERTRRAGRRHDQPCHRQDGQAPWFEIDSTGDASRVSVAISFVDDAGRGGLVTAIAPVDR